MSIPTPNQTTNKNFEKKVLKEISELQSKQDFLEKQIDILTKTVTTLKRVINSRK